MKSNAEVLKMIGLKKTELVMSIKKKKLTYYGHVRRHNSLQKIVLQGEVDGKRGSGRRRKSWTGNVSEMTKMSMARCSVKALGRSEWRKMVSNLYAETELRLIECGTSGWQRPMREGSFWSYLISMDMASITPLNEQEHYPPIGLNHCHYTGGREVVKAAFGEHWRKETGQMWAKHGITSSSWPRFGCTKA